MIIGIDFDSTLAKIDQPWLDRLNQACGTNYRAEDWSDWDLTFLQAAHKKLFFSLLTPDLYDSVFPYPHAAEAIKQLARISGVKLLCVTSNPKVKIEEFTAAKKNWLAKYIPELSESVVIADVKSGLGLDVLVDDAPMHVTNGSHISVLVRRPWNCHIRVAFEFEDWRDGQKTLEKIIQNLRTKN